MCIRDRVEIEHELIVLGKTSLSSLHLDEDNDVLFLGGIEFKVGIFILSSGAFQVLEQPKGPIFCTHSESNIIENRTDIQCFVDFAMGETHGNFQDLLLRKFIGEDDDIYDLDIELIIEAIRTEENIFK